MKRRPGRKRAMNTATGPYCITKRRIASSESGATARWLKRVIGSSPYRRLILLCQKLACATPSRLVATGRTGSVVEQRPGERLGHGADGSGHMALRPHRECPAGGRRGVREGRGRGREA